MHISQLVPETYPEAMQRLGTAPVGQASAIPAGGASSAISRLSSGLEVTLLVIMSGLVSLLLSIVVVGAI